MAPLDDDKYIHFSHNHPLEERLCGETDVVTCSGCRKLIYVGKVYYSCKPCSYSLHTACFRMSMVFHHVSDPGHNLNLLVKQSFECKACGLEGSGFCYRCETCDANYHSLCIKMPLSVSCATHQHDLKLQFAPPYGEDIGFRCDVCRKASDCLWLYRCNECNFDVHLNCVFAAPSQLSLPQNLPRTESRGPVLSVSSGIAPSSLIPSSSAGKLQSHNSTLSGPVSPMILGDSPFSSNLRTRIPDTLDQSSPRVQRPMRLSMEQTSRQRKGVGNNASSEQSVRN